MLINPSQYDIVFEPGSRCRPACHRAQRYYLLFLLADGNPRLANRGCVQVLDWKRKVLGWEIGQRYLSTYLAGALDASALLFVHRPCCCSSVVQSCYCCSVVTVNSNNSKESLTLHSSTLWTLLDAAGPLSRE